MKDLILYIINSNYYEISISISNNIVDKIPNNKKNIELFYKCEIIHSHVDKFLPKNKIIIYDYMKNLIKKVIIRI